MEPMREKLGMEVKSFRHKVVQPRVWQLFTPSQRERDAFVQNLDTVCGPYVYKDASVHAVPIFPEDLRVIRLKEQQVIEAQPDERWYKDPDISSDAQYDDISRNRDPIEFLVKRDPKRADMQETIQFYDVFVMTVGDEQQALKRTNTLDNFRNVELKRFVDTYGKAYGKAVTEILLNYYLSFDTLGG
ncbi:hypothetical protein RvY_09551-3 [Ramazzottius varieornatus]|nr:hypothetical protein RvY_09551-3 [Ramazzottius varieornatus]